MTVAQLRKQLQGLPARAVIVLAVEVDSKDDSESSDDDHYAIERPAARVTLRPDLKVQIGDDQN